MEKILFWKNDTNTLFTEFMYLSDLSKNSIKTGFKNDILQKLYFVNHQLYRMYSNLN